MKAVLSAIAQNCTNVREQLELPDILLRTLAGRYRRNAPKLSQLTLRSRQQSYVSGVIAIYGLVEESVDDVLMATAHAYSAILKNFDDLPSNVQLNHRNLILQALLRGGEARIRTPINEKAALVGLSLVTGMPMAPLSAAAFTMKNANYRHEYICSLLERLDIKPQGSKRISDLDATIAAESLGFKDISSFMRDLVERRNEAAHSHSGFSMVDVAILRSYLDVVEAYLIAIHDSANEKILRLLAEKRLQPLGKVVRSLTHYIGIDQTAGAVSPGDTLFFVKKDRIQFGKITTLQVNGVPKSRVVHAGSTIQLGVVLDGGHPTTLANSTTYLWDPVFDEFA